MADTLHLEIVTAGGAAVDTQAQQVTLPLADGEAGILPGHAPLLGALVSGVVRYTSGGAEHYCAVSPGTVNVAANTVTVLARTAESAPDIDLPRAEAALRRAESDLEVRGMEMNVSTAEADRARAHARIRAVKLWRDIGSKTGRKPPHCPMQRTAAGLQFHLGYEKMSAYSLTQTFLRSPPCATGKTHGLSAEGSWYAARAQRTPPQVRAVLASPV